MRPVKIITDSCADLGVDMLDRYSIDYARMHTVINGVEYWDELRDPEYTQRYLYDYIRSGERVYTSQVPVVEFERIFRLYAEQGFDIVYVANALAVTGSLNNGVMAARMLQEQGFENEICCVDSYTASIGVGMLAVEGAKLAEAGKSAKEIADILSEKRLHIHEYITVNSLDALKRGGRIRPSEAFLGNLLGVKPIVCGDRYGAQYAVKKVKGRRSSLQELANGMIENIENAEGQTLFLAHADCPDDAERLKAMVQEALPVDVYINCAGACIGSNVGADCIGIFCFGKEVTHEVGK